MPRLFSSLASRAFLFAFLPLALTFAGIVLTIHSTVKARVREGLQESIEHSERTLEQSKDEMERRNRQLLALVSEDSGLKAGLGLLREARYGQEPDARALALLNEQVKGLAKSSQYDFVVLLDSETQPITALDRQARSIPLDRIAGGMDLFPVIRYAGGYYTATTVPVNVGDENLGAIIFGKKLVLDSAENEFEALVAGGKALVSNLPSVRLSELEDKLQSKCGGTSRQCEVKLASENFVVAPVRRSSLGDRVSLLKLVSIDAATSAFVNGLDQLFLGIALIGVLVAATLASFGSRSISKPITRLIAQLHESEREGSFRPAFPVPSRVAEVHRLEEAFERAAFAIQESQSDLERATLEFIESMATALDARDPYTAGHSNRVSVNAATVAETLGFSPGDVDIVRIGAKLHDIGKIGIPDTVLQKPGKLTNEEFAMIRMHPQIGRRILERAKRFEMYLPIVELHHENFDGSGYPYGLRGEEISTGVMIVHVVDVYDAISSNRAYRAAMPERQVMEILLDGAGKLFDPVVLDAFLAVLRQKRIIDMASEPRTEIHAEP